jgi:hypothetical protein
MPRWSEWQVTSLRSPLIRIGGRSVVKFRYKVGSKRRSYPELDLQGSPQSVIALSGGTPADLFDPSWAHQFTFSNLHLLRCDARYHSRSRRQHFMPLPKPSSFGRYSHGMPGCRTYRMPFNAARSSTVLRRPPLGDGANTGISGSDAAHSSLLILRLDMPPGYGFHGLMSRLC